MTYDQAQSPRLGQRTSVESTYVQMFDVDPTTPEADLLEAAWPGMLIYRQDLGILQIYNGPAGAWESISGGGGGAPGQLTYVRDTAPVGAPLGSLWYDTSQGMLLHWLVLGEDGGPNVWVPLPMGEGALDTGAVTGPKIRVGALDGQVITAPVIQTHAQPTVGLHLDQNGFRAYDLTTPVEGVEKTPFMDVDPAKGLVIVAGEGTFKTLTIQEAGAITGDVSVKDGASLVLTEGTVAPTSPPTVSLTLKSFVPGDDGKWGNRRGWATSGSNYYTMRVDTGKLEKWTMDGVLIATSPSYVPTTGGAAPSISSISVATDMTSGGVAVFVGYVDTATDTAKVTTFHGVSMGLTKTNIYDSGYYSITAANSHHWCVGWDWVSNKVLIGQVRTSDQKLLIRSATLGAHASDVVIDSTLTTDLVYSTTHHLCNVYREPGFDFDDSSARYMVASQANEVSIFTDSGSYVDAEAFIPGYTTKCGLSYNRYTGEFMTMRRAAAGYMYTHMCASEDMTLAENKRWYYCSNVRKSGSTTVYETPQGPAVGLGQELKRRQLTLTGPPLKASPGADDPNAIKFYESAGSTATSVVADRYRLNTGSAGVNTFTTYLSLLSGDPITVIPFPTSVPGYIKSGRVRIDQAPATNMDGLGAANVDGLIPPGSMVMYGGSVEPVGWKFCNGASLSTALEPDLFAAIGYSYGGSGANFNLPNLAGRFPLGAGTTSPSDTVRALGTSSGADERTIGANYLPDHTHPIRRSSDDGTSGVNVKRGGATDVGDASTLVNASSETPLPTIPPYTTVNFIIKT